MFQQIYSHEHTGGAKKICPCLSCAAQRQAWKPGDPVGLFEMPSPSRVASQTAIMPDPELQMCGVRAGKIEDLKHLVNGLMQQIVYLQSRINSL